ncbi:MAG TPA: M48 family metalloprotease, partial [Candidatus Ozemobacteraceae bacterium]|nr:M48 family metalloprotease [Candidatus Ozemobacteraceae bacterium]
MKNYGMLLVLLLLLGAAGLVMLGQREDRSDLTAVMELVGDAQQDALKVGHELLKMSDDEENRLGREVVGRFGFGLSEAPRLASYVTAVARPLLAHVRRPRIEYVFRVLDSGEVNAFALPGGQIFVFRGLIECVESEAELAAVLGHEIAHVDLRHCVELFLVRARLEKIVGGGFPRTIVDLIVRLPANLTIFTHQLIKAGYRKFQEFDADAEGMNLIARAGYLPTGSVMAMQR